jgi:hypothetical protein|tara:strand:- start:617 stop:718 length:102 start_codon:yes stop_codon:yes gene_type:complete
MNALAVEVVGAETEVHEDLNFLAGSQIFKPSTI